jgi:hypothetical protein
VVAGGDSEPIDGFLIGVGWDDGGGQFCDDDLRVLVIGVGKGWVDEGIVEARWREATGVVGTCHGRDRRFLRCDLGGVSHALRFCTCDDGGGVVKAFVSRSARGLRGVAGAAHCSAATGCELSIALISSERMSEP